MYRLHLQLTPQIHEGQMKFYWHIDLHTTDGQFTVAHGWNKDAGKALQHAQIKAQELGII